MLLVQALPEIAQELTTLLQDDQPSLAYQIPNLQLVDRCRCGDDFCATVYTEPPPHSFGAGHENIPLDPEKGWIILDVMHGKIHVIEILYRPEVRKRILELFP